MLYIECPWGGFRDDEEFHYGGEAHIKRPTEPNELNDEEFSEYLYLKSNPKGVILERWLHSRGCRRWFNVLRNTVTNEITEIYPIDTLPKSKEGKEYYDQNWRRESSVEKTTNPRENK